MNSIKTKLKNRDKLHQIFIIILSISMSFTIFFFSPMELMMRNQKEFLVNTEQILFPMLILSVLSSVISIVLLHVLLMIHETVYIFISRIMAGLLFSCYIQEMLLNGKMNSLTGDAVEVNLPMQKHILNLMLAYLMLMLPLILHFMQKQYPDWKFLRIGKGYILPYLTGLIFVMQIFGLFGTTVQFGLNQYENFFNVYFSYEPSMSLSKEKNIIVFLEDRLDSLYMDEVLENYPELYQELDGFTFYQNNLSHYPQTFPSITHMLTSRAYTDEDEHEYFQQAWAKENFLDVLKQNDYHINLLIDSQNTYGDYSDLENRCDNIAFLDDDAYSFNYLDENGIIPVMTILSLGKLVPYCMKGFFTAQIKSDFSSEFIRFADDIPSCMPGAIGETSDLKYYDYLMSTGLTDDHPQNTFTFMHFNGAHDSSEKVSRLYSDEYLHGSFGSLSTIRGEFEIIFEYIRQMKALSIYEQSTIIILGDHGRIFEDITDDSGRLTEPIVTALLIKPAQAESAELKIDSTAELSNDYFSASILDYAGIDHDAYGCSYLDVIEQHIYTERIFQIITDQSHCYKITGDAREFSNWQIEN